MRGIRNFIKRFLRDEEGATATEYAVMLVLIIVVSIVTISVLGTKVNEGFKRVETELTKGINKAPVSTP